MISPEHLTAGLEAAFTRIQRERMTDVPILNPELRVQAVGFSVREEYCLGVLITPWFMNLMLLPLAGDAWAGLPPGSRIDQAFPSGSYEFILGEAEGIGRYLMCSLFSPVFEFENQAAAVATAEAVLTGLMDEASRAEDGTREGEIRRIWNGAAGTGSADAAGGGEAPRAALEERIRKPISRRDLLRGAFLGGKG
jgi:[NiFe] hydrogenase assembly HybE family chaperone